MENDQPTPGPWRWVFVSTAGQWFMLGNNGEGPITNSGPDSADGRLKQAAPALLAAAEALLENETSSYCERCQRHAPKDDQGHLIGPIPHIEGCAVGMARAAIAAAKEEPYLANYDYSGDMRDEDVQGF